MGDKGDGRGESSLLGVKVEQFSSSLLFMSGRAFALLLMRLALNQVREVGCQPLAHRAVLWVIVTSGDPCRPGSGEGA